MVHDDCIGPAPVRQGAEGEMRRTDGDAWQDIAASATCFAASSGASARPIPMTIIFRRKSLRFILLHAPCNFIILLQTSENHQETGTKKSSIDAALFLFLCPHAVTGRHCQLPSPAR
jgi:hypothetical protein